MSDNLDTLRNRELDDLFAVEVCEWESRPDGYGEYNYWCLKVAPYTQQKKTCSFHPSTDANAVLPWLERVEWWESVHDTSMVIAPYAVTAYTDDSACFIGHGATFSRAAVIALLRAKRAEKGGAR